MTSSSRGSGTGLGIGDLPQAAQNILNTGLSSNSEWAGPPVSLAYYVMHAGGSEDDYYRLAETSEMGASHPEQSQLPRTLSRAWEWAEEHFEPAVRGGHVQDLLQQVLPAIDHYPDFNDGQRATARALVEHAIRVGNFQVDASVRTLAEATGARPSTVSAHLKAIAASPFISKVQGNAPGKAKTYIINISTGEGYEPEDSSAGIVWTKHGLGPTAKRVYDCLNDEPATRASIRRAAGLADNTTKKYLAVLQGEGLADCTSESRPRWFRTSATPDTSEAEANREAMHQRHAQEREDHAKQVAGELERALNSMEYLYPEFPHWKRDQFKGHYGAFRLNDAGREVVRKQGWAWPHWRTPLEYREYDPAELEAALANNDYAAPAYPRQAFGADADKRTGHRMYYRLNGAGVAQAKVQGWAWRHWEMPEQYREYMTREQWEDRLGPVWGPGGVS